MVVTGSKGGDIIRLTHRERDCLLGHLEDDLELSPEEYKSNERYVVVKELVEKMRAVIR